MTQTIPEQESATSPTLSLSRQILYRFASLCLADPRSGSWPHLAALRRDRLLPGAAALIRSTPQAHVASLRPGECSLKYLNPRRVLHALPNSNTALNRAFEDVFGLLVSSNCPPNETEYINSKFTFQRSQDLADVAGFYRAFGLTRSATNHEREDHVVLQLAFMSHVAGLEANAQREDDEAALDRAAVCHEAQRKFFAEHLGWWGPAFATLLLKRGSSGFYASIAEFIAALIAADRGILGVDIVPDIGRPTRIERPEECEGCGLAME
jgi:TorA maturation chaperone TorD